MLPPEATMTLAEVVAMPKGAAATVTPKEEAPPMEESPTIGKDELEDVPTQEGVEPATAAKSAVEEAIN